MNKKLRALIFAIAVILLFGGIVHNSLFVINKAFAATNISSVTAEHYAWNDNIGWIDFFSTSNVNVFSDHLEGYATSSAGFIGLNCNTSPNGNICAGPGGNWYVSNDGNGNLSGWAWNDNVGWISFNCANTGTCATSSYQVIIDGATGDFRGWAWNDAIGWISFNCVNTSSCSTSNYKVKTVWLAGSVNATVISSAFDTNVASGVALNAVMWQGTQPAGTNVKIQIASSNCANGATNPPTCNTGAWSYIGPDGSAASYYNPSGPGIPVQINLQYHNNYRYFRYKVILQSNFSQTLTPQVNNVIVNWSP